MNDATPLKAPLRMSETLFPNINNIQFMIQKNPQNQHILHTLGKIVSNNVECISCIIYVDVFDGHVK